MKKILTNAVGVGNAFRRDRSPTSACPDQILTAQ
jgi:hypothetical protein